LYICLGIAKYDHERIGRKYIEFIRQRLPLDKEAIGFVDAVARARALSLRSLEKILSYMALAMIFTTSKHFSFFRPSAILAGLCVLKALEPQLFEKAKSGLLTLEEAFAAFRLSQWPESMERQWAFKWWQYALSKDLDLKNPEWQQFVSQARFQFSVDREDIVTAVAGGVIDRMQIPEE
jgi:hypothetical protein